MSARPLGAAERDVREAADIHDEDQLLKLLVHQPGYSIAEMAQAMGWFYGGPDRQPNKSKGAEVIVCAP